ncbi:DUF3971 domain-containing protein [Shimia haliotis]|uniref:Uncharacterized protein n=1 Tax=Shimia haliotis TaxID=1280847 RepID=A0A1I4BDV7_9RHOB|nr:DUF3971 domain-containing protein [Shimia haliotis]SFK66151.1 Protein of unknown function [Shimia haliotis]
MIGYEGQPITDQPEAQTLTEQAENTTAETKPARRGARRARGFGLVMLLALLVPAAAGAILLVAVAGGPVVLPEWARERAERVLDRQLAAVDVRFGEMSLVLEDNWDPKLRVTGLELAPQQGGAVLRLEQVDLQLAMEPLLGRQVAPRSVQVAGVNLKVMRRANGTVNVSLGQGEGGLQRDAALTSIGQDIEAVLSRPGFRFLETFDIEDVTLRYEDSLSKRAWTIDGGRLALQRDGDDVSISSHMTLLGGRSFATTLEGSVTTSFDSGTVQVGLKFEDAPSEELASQVAALSWLEVLRAPISGAMRVEIDDAGALGSISATLSASAGFVQPNDEVVPIPFESLRSYLTYDPATQRIGFDELSVTADWLRASVSGQALLRDFESGLPNALLAQLTLNSFEATPETLGDTSVGLDTSYMDFRLQLNPFDLELGQLVINQSGMQMSLKGDLSAGSQGWEYGLDGHMNGVEPAQVLALWPVQFKDKLRKWIDENIFAAKLSDVNLALRSRVGQPPDVYADFQFRDAVVKAVKTMPPVEGGRGFAVFTDNKFHVGVEGGYVTPDTGGTIDVAGSSFVVLNTRLKQSPGQADVKAVGSIEAAASLLNRPPLSVFDKANLPVAIAKGRVEAEGRLDFIMKPKLPAEEVRFDVTGRLIRVDSDVLLQGSRLRGDLMLAATNDAVEIFGPGRVGAVPVQARWFAKLGKPGAEGSGDSSITGQVELSAAVLEEFNVGLPSGTVSGRGEADFSVDFRKGQVPRLTVSSDLKGVGLASPPIGWRKPANSSGQFDMAMTLGKQPRVDALSLKAAGLDAKGSVTLSEGGALEVVDVPEFTLGRWLTGAMRLRGRGAGVAPAIEMLGGRFDMRAMPEFGGASTQGSGQSGPITGRLDEAIIANNIVVRDASFALTTQNGLSGTFDGALAGHVPISGKLGLHPNGTAIEVTSPNAGGVVQAMGLVAQADKGNLLLRLVPREQKDVYDGLLKIEDIKVQSLPSFAELLNAVSVVGLLEQLNGPGLLFNEVHSVFRMAPGEIVIGEASAVGASMGLSADGRYLTTQGILDIQGVLSPIYAVNVIGRPISKRGEGLIGFNYELKGPAKDPSISVNPLSALTPGFFREIFRRAPPDLSN